MLIDSHCHISFKDYSSQEREEVLERAAANGVDCIINIGAGEGVDGNIEAVAFAKKHPQVFCTVGIHPHDAKMMDDHIIHQIEELAKNPKVVAIGEVGLDFHYSHSPHDVQERVFSQFLELAKRVNKPVIVHDREAGERTYEILKQSGIPKRQVVIHCYTGSLELAKKYLELGCLLSFTGIITFKHAEGLRGVVKLTRVEDMLIETDSPYLTPIPHRGKKNEPAFVLHVAEAIAKIKGLSLADVARITTLNAKRFFRLPLLELGVSVVYAIRNSLYLNITNQCTLACRFCRKFVDYEVKGYFLKLPHEPTVEEVMAQIGDCSSYKEVVFCGYGEPTRRLDALLEISKQLKKNHPHLKIRVNTDGLGNLVYQKNILPDLSKYIDALSISLNAPDAETYTKNCPSKFKEQAYSAVKEFIVMAKNYIPDITATVVGLPGIDQEECRQIAEKELGVKFRWRPLDEVG